MTWTRQQRHKARLDDRRAGRRAPQTGRFVTFETIGPPECPIMDRWTLLNTRVGKVFLHRFYPNADDRAVHDHPWSFVTLVLRGGYDDMVPSMSRGGTLVVGDRMRAGSIRRRDPGHRHRTHVGPDGCWSLVVTGPVRQVWGFFHEGRKWAWDEFERTFGFGMRCE